MNRVLALQMLPDDQNSGPMAEVGNSTSSAHNCACSTNSAAACFAAMGGYIAAGY